MELFFFLVVIQIVLVGLVVMMRSVVFLAFDQLFLNQPAARRKRRDCRNRCRLGLFRGLCRMFFFRLLLLAAKSKEPETRRRQRIDIMRSAAIAIEFGALVLFRGIV